MSEEGVYRHERDVLRVGYVGELCQPRWTAPFSTSSGRSNRRNISRHSSSTNPTHSKPNVAIGPKHARPSRAYLSHVDIRSTHFLGHSHDAVIFSTLCCPGLSDQAFLLLAQHQHRHRYQSDIKYINYGNLTCFDYLFPMPPMLGRHATVLEWTVHRSGWSTG